VENRVKTSYIKIPSHYFITSSSKEAKYLKQHKPNIIPQKEHECSHSIAQDQTVHELSESKQSPR